MKLKISLLALAFGLGICATSSRALSPADTFGPPALIDYQGKVLDSAGQPLNSTTATNYSIQFRLWNDQNATNLANNLVWAESQIVTVDTDGTFSVRLGSGAAIVNASNVDIGNVPHANLKGAFNGDQRYLGVTVVVADATPVEIIPRLQFLTAPFSLVAQSALNASNVTQTSGTATLTNVNISNAQISGGSFTGTGSGLTTLNASSITTGTVSSARLPSDIAYTSAANNFNNVQAINSTDYNNGQWLLNLKRSVALNSAFDGTNTLYNFETIFALGIERFGTLVGGSAGDAVMATNGRNMIFSTNTYGLTGTYNPSPVKGIVLDAANNVGIGNISGGFKLDVYGSLRCSGGVNTSSDARYKKDVRTVEAALEKIGALRGVSYGWDREAFPGKNFPEGRAIGFIAQEVEKVLPEAVSKDADGYYSIAYSEVIPVLVEGTKALQAENAALKARVEALEAREQASDKKLAGIEKLLLDAAKREAPQTVSLQESTRP